MNDTTFTLDFDWWVKTVLTAFVTFGGLYALSKL